MTRYSSRVVADGLPHNLGRDEWISDSFNEGEVVAELMFMERKMQLIHDHAATSTVDGIPVRPSDPTLFTALLKKETEY